MTLRITNIVDRPAPVSISVDGCRVSAHPGESVAAALLAVGLKTLRYSPGTGQPRGLFCLMGVCQECLLSVDGKRALACQTVIRDGMVILTGELP